MQLNTKEILSATSEVIFTDGITYHRISRTDSGRPIEEWGDHTTPKNRSLYGYEVDRNFYNLKAAQIKSARWDEEKSAIVLERYGRDEFDIIIPFQTILETLQQTVDEHSEQIEKLETEVALVDAMLGAGASGDTEFLTNVVKNTVVSDETFKANEAVTPVINQEDKTVEFQLGAIVATIEDEE